MPRFIYKVQNAAGEVASGTLEAGDENEAISNLQNKGYFILSVSSDRAAGALGPQATYSSVRSKVGIRDRVFFAEQLATLLNGGVPLVRALSLLSEHSSSRGIKRAVGQVTRDVAGGMALYKAMEKQPDVFDNLWVSLVQAGEMGGQLPKVLREIGSYLAAKAELQAKIITALAYPAVLLAMSLGVLAFFIIRIVPVFAEIFTSFQIKLPPLTMAVIACSNLFVRHLPILVFIIIGIIFLWSAYTATDSGKATKAELIFSIPFFGDFVMNLLVERMLTTLSTLIESGVSILNAIAVLEGVFSNNIIFRRLLISVREDVTGGKSISAAFKKSGILPPLVSEMMFMGEESGKLPDMLVSLAAFYREQVDQFTRRFTAIIDPILVVGVGGFVGLIVLSIFMPIFRLSTMSGGAGH